MAQSLVHREELCRRLDRCQDLRSEAAAAFLKMKGVLGVGCGPRERGGKNCPDEPCLIVYVREKKPRGRLRPDQIIPSEFNGVPTDVVVPRPRTSPAHESHDFSWIDWTKVHHENPNAGPSVTPSAADYDLDHVAVLEIDNTFVSGSYIDFVKAAKRFLQAHPDSFDFIAFFVDTASGLPGQGSWHSGVFNDTKGINYYRMVQELQTKSKRC